MRNKIFGGIGMLWGSSIVLRWLFSAAPPASSAAYQNGQSGAVILGVAMLCAGLYYFFKKPA